MTSIASGNESQYEPGGIVAMSRARALEEQLGGGLVQQALAEPDNQRRDHRRLAAHLGVVAGPADGRVLRDGRSGVPRPAVLVARNGVLAFGQRREDDKVEVARMDAAPARQERRRHLPQREGGHRLGRPGYALGYALAGGNRERLVKRELLAEKKMADNIVKPSLHMLAQLMT